MGGMDGYEICKDKRPGKPGRWPVEQRESQQASSGLIRAQTTLRASSLITW